MALFLSFVCGAVLRGAGDSRTPLQAAVLANVINVAVAYALIFGHLGLPALGVAGSALGAASGRSLGAAYMLVMMARGRKAISLARRLGLAASIDTARQLLKLGVPAAIEQVLSVGAFMVLVGVVALIGTAALAAQQITFTALSLAFLPAFGFSMAATALVGQSIGARTPADAQQGVADRAALGGGLDGDGGVLAFLFSGRVMNVFSADPAVIAAGTIALRALSIALPFWALWFVGSGGLRGSGDTRTPLIIGASTMWLSVLIAWIAVRWFAGGLGTVWFAFVLTTSPASLLMWWTYPPAHRRLRAGTARPSRSQRRRRALRERLDGYQLLAVGCWLLAFSRLTALPTPVRQHVVDDSPRRACGTGVGAWQGSEGNQGFPQGPATTSGPGRVIERKGRAERLPAFS